MLSLFMRLFGKKIKRKQWRMVILVLATVAILLSSLLPLLSVLIK